MSIPACIRDNPSISSHQALVCLMDKADDLHDLVVDTDMSLREFMAGALSYMPGWMRFLYRIRKYLVLLLGTRQDGIPDAETIRPEELSFTPGEKGAFFTITGAQEDAYWIGEASDRMIVGHLAVVREELATGSHRFHFLSGASYRHWTGRIYYNLILPIHHLVIRLMARDALKARLR